MNSRKERSQSASYLHGLSNTFGYNISICSIPLPGQRIAIDCEMKMALLPLYVALWRCGERSGSRVSRQPMCRKSSDSSRYRQARNKRVSLPMINTTMGRRSPRADRSFFILFFALLTVNSRSPWPLSSSHLALCRSSTSRKSLSLVPIASLCSLLSDGRP